MVIRRHLQIHKIHKNQIRSHIIEPNFNVCYIAVPSKVTSPGDKENVLGRPMSLKSPVITPSRQPTSLGEFLSKYNAPHAVEYFNVRKICVALNAY